MTSNDEVPAALRRLWGRTEPSRVGRPAALDVDTVVRAAIELADRDGLAGVTLPKVASRLGFTSMSLYRHVDSKDELLVLMSDAAHGTPPPVTGLSWREGLRRWAVSHWEMYQRRPWLARVPQNGPPSGPSQIAWMETALTALAETGLDWGRKLGVLSVLSGYVRNSAVLSQDLAAGRGADVAQIEAEQAYGRALAALVDPARYPEVAKVFASPIFDYESTVDESGVDLDFIFGMELILDGVETAVRG